MSKTVLWPAPVLSRRTLLAAVAASLALALAVDSHAADGDPERGAEAFRVCAACHSLQPGRHMTGPSLAGIWGAEAGAQGDFRRYSDALLQAEFAWRGDTLEAFIADPQALVPGTRMRFRGVDDPQVRGDLVAFLKAASEDPGMADRAPSQDFPDLGDAPPARIVTAIGYCGDTYTVTTQDGRSRAFWEFNLRFKTDSGDNGPKRGEPVLMRAGMMGDRTFVIFAAPEEFGRFVERRC